MRNLLWVVVAGLVIGAGYIVFTGKSLRELIGQVQDAGQPAVEASGEVEAATNAVQEAAQEGADAAAGMSEEAADAAQDAANSITDAAEGAADTASEAAEETVNSVSEAAGQAVDALEEAAGGAGEWLTPEGFDLDKALDLIENSDLGGLKKTALAESIKAAAEDPDLLNAALASVREALGL